MTYSSLIQDVLEYCERKDDEVIGQIPRLIMLAENRISDEVRGLGFLRVVQSHMEAGNPVLRKPENWRESSSLRLKIGTRNKTVFKRSYEYCTAYNEDTGIKGVPRFYGDYDVNHMFVAPSPADNYSFEYIYYEKPQALSEENQTNWTTENAPNLLLYAVLLEGQVYLKQDARVEMIKSFYVQTAQTILESARRRELDRSSGMGG